jgi:hypothetical protein
VLTPAEYDVVIVTVAHPQGDIETWIRHTSHKPSERLARSAEMVHNP